MRSWLGNLEKMTYLVTLFWVGCHIYFMYRFIYCA